jgi:hypothetical protein
VFERLFVEQLRIVGLEVLKVAEEPIKNPSKSRSKRASKRDRKKEADLRKQGHRLVTRLRRMAEIAYELAVDERSLAAMQFISSLIDGRPSFSQEIAVTRITSDSKTEFTYEEARDYLTAKGIDLNRVPLLADLQPIPKITDEVNPDQPVEVNSDEPPLR